MSRRALPLLVLALAFSGLTLACGDNSSPTAPADGDTDALVDGDGIEQEAEPEAEQEAEQEAWMACTFCQKPILFPTTAKGAAFSAQLLVTGGTPPYTNWRLAKGDAAHGNMDGKELGSLPGGLTLDAKSGLISGTPSAEGYSYFVVAVDDSQGLTSSQTYGLQIGDPAKPGPLALRADGYQKIYEARHVFHGTSYDIERGDATDGKYGLTTLGDNAFHSGQCSMAQAFRTAVLKTEDAKKLTRQLSAGWRFFQRLTGVKGLIGRSYFHKDDPVEAVTWEQMKSDPTMWKQGSGDEFKDYYWRTDTSRDQMTGAILGNAALYDFTDDPETKANAKQFLVDVADHVWDNGLKIVDWTGKMTTYGDMSGEQLEGWPVGNAQTAVCLLAWFKIAHHVSGEARFKEHYEELLYQRDYLGILRDHEWTFAGYNTKWYNTYMSWENWYHLVRLEEDPTLHATLSDILRDTLWLNTDDKTVNRRAILEHNAVKTPWYLYSTGQKDPEALWRVLWQMQHIPDAPLRDRSTHNSSDATIVRNTDGPINETTREPTEALYALPFDQRESDMVVWHRTAFELDKPAGSTTERTGCDFMLPYWMGRYYGYISAQW